MHQLVRLGQFMTAAPPNPNTTPKQQHKQNDGKFHRDDRKRRAEKGAARLDRGHDGIAQASGCHGRTGARHHGCRLHRAGRATAGEAGSNYGHKYDFGTPASAADIAKVDISQY